MSAKTKSERLRRLISHGYFAPELPPCFVSDDLARHRRAILAGIDSLPLGRRGDPAFYNYYSEPASFYFPRFGKEDRRHGVPNPIAHLLLSRVIADNYIDLRRKARASGITLSPPVFDWLGSRALVRSSVELRDNFRGNLSTRREEYVVGDLRAFFHSIYTHAIPWAIHTKAFAKRNRGSAHYGNLLDLLCRNAQDGQTLGLPVGPDTSRLLAETIASAVDADLKRRLGIGPRDASRYVDDYTLSSPSAASGEEMLAALRLAAGSFELELNNEKSAVYLTSRRQSSGWQQAARAHIPRSPPNASVSVGDLQHFFYQLGNVCIAHPEINVEKFGIQNARSALVQAQNWTVPQSNLISAYRRNPSLVALLVEIILLRQVAHNDVRHSDLTEFIEGRIPVLARANRSGEIIWLLFLAVRLRLTLRASALSSLFTIENSFIALLVVYLNNQALIRGSIDRSTWDRSLNADGLRGPMWLYAYEAVAGGFLPRADAGFIYADPFLGLLMAKKVRFLDMLRGYTSIAFTLRGLRSENERLRRLRQAILDNEDGEYDDLEDEEYDDDEFEPADIY